MYYPVSLSDRRGMTEQDCTKLLGSLLPPPLSRGEILLASSRTKLSEGSGASPALSPIPSLVEKIMRVSNTGKPCYCPLKVL